MQGEEEMLPQPENTPMKIPRRGFLGLLGATGAGLAIKGLLGNSPKVESSNKPPTSEITSRPDGSISPEELKQVHIRIYNTSETELFITKKTMEIPLFRDAAKGITGEAVIVLVDGPSLTWEASESLPEELKRAYQAGNLEPLKSGVSRVDLGQFIRIGTGRQFDADEKSPGFESLYKRQQEFLNDFPDKANTNYIFVAVGGDKTPIPDQKINPQMYREKKSGGISPPDANDQYKYDWPAFAGIILEHEVQHYKNNEEVNNEQTADALALESVKKINQNDPKSFNFIFRNLHGLTYAKNKGVRIGNV